MKYLQEYFSSKEGKEAQYVKLVKHEKCKGQEHLAEKLKEVEAKGGEGLMLRKPKSLYVGARSTTLLKVKSFFDDEAKVLRVRNQDEKNPRSIPILFILISLYL